MTNFMQHASRLAIVATLAATPMAIMAQTDTVKPVDEAASTEAEAGADVTSQTDTDATGMTNQDASTDTATTEAPADAATSDPATTATDTMTTEAPATTQAPATDTMTTEAPVDAEANTEVAAEEQPKPVEGQIRMQSENTILAEDLIGSSVYSENGEAIGDIEDLIVNLDGSVDGVVIGVGGFLGMGEKWVALEMVSLSTTTDENQNLRLITSASKIDLEAAEPFITARELDAAKSSLETMPPVDTAAEPADTTAPAASN